MVQRKMRGFPAASCSDDGAGFRIKLVTHKFELQFAAAVRQHPKRLLAGTDTARKCYVARQRVFVFLKVYLFILKQEGDTAILVFSCPAQAFLSSYGGGCLHFCASSSCSRLLEKGMVVLL